MKNLEVNVRFAARGILIMLVMLGHNRIFRDNYYYTGYLFIYAFHVGSFFLITALSPPRAMNKSVVIGLARRVLLPFAAGLIIYWAIYAIENLYEAGGELAPWAERLALAAVLANAWVFRAAAGLKMLWFLPAFFIFCLIYNLYGLAKGKVSYFFLGGTIAAHLLVGTLPSSWLYYVPWSINVVAFLIFPALLFLPIENAIRGKLPLEIASIVVLTTASIAALRSNYAFVLSDSVIPSWHAPLALLLGDCQLIFGCISVLAIARWLQSVRILTELGKRSLQLYLIHPLVNIAATMLFARLLPWPAAMVLATASTIIVTYLLVLAGERTAFTARIFGTSLRTSS